MVKITFLNAKQVVETAQGSELLEVAGRDPTIPLKFGCRQGECGICMIEICSGAQHLTKMSAKEAETLKRKNAGPNFRLACQCALNGDIEISSIP